MNVDKLKPVTSHGSCLDFDFKWSLEQVIFLYGWTTAILVSVFV